MAIADNTSQFPEAYRDYFEFVNDRANGLRTMTLPFEGDLEFTVRLQRRPAEASRPGLDPWPVPLVGRWGNSAFASIKSMPYS